MNGYLWTIQYVNPDDPMLRDRLGVQTVGTTDGKTQTIYLSNKLSGDFKIKVLLHELGHVAMFCFDLFDDIHKMVLPKYWIEAEEWICNFIADYGKMIFDVAYKVLGENGIICVPRELEKLIA